MNRYIKNILIRGRSKFIDMANRFKSNKAIFEDIYKKGGWKNDESVSGSGSTLDNAKNIVQLLPNVFREYSIRSMLDIPCGDFNWMKKVPLDGIKYFGCDIVTGLIESNKKKYSLPDLSFFVADLLSDELPTVDLILCRDCLVHFSNRDVRKALKNIVNSESRFLLTTTFPASENHSIVTGNWRPLNLQAPPFNLPEPVQICVENCEEYKDKSVALWRIESLKKVLL